MTELISTLSKLSDDYLFVAAIHDNDEERYKYAEEYFNDFKNVYSKISRHRYSEISKFINEDLTGDSLDALSITFDCIIESAQYNQYHLDSPDSDNRKTYNSLLKLYDHISLEIQRASYRKESEFKINSIKAEQLRINKQVKNANDSVELAEQKARNLSEQLISILGIFAGIIVTFSFAVTTIGEALANLTSSNVTFLAFIICVLGIVFISAITLLMCFISKLSGHKFNSITLWVLYGLSNLILILLALYFHSKI